MVAASVRFVAPRLPDRVCSVEPPKCSASWSKSVPSVVILVIVFMIVFVIVFSVSDIHTILLP